MRKANHFRKRLLALLLIVCVVSLNACKSGVGTVVKNNYENEQGLIQNYANEPKAEYLSESIGQYMYYLAMVKDKKEFQRQTDILEKFFIVEEDDQLFIKWQANKSTSVNAAIDDFRIIEALKKASNEFDEPNYLELAKQLEQPIIANQLTDGLIVDFYDWKLKKKSSSIFLSYYNNEVYEEHKSLNRKSYQKIVEGAIESKTPFFKEIYDVENQSYQTVNKKSVNLIDQLLIAVAYIELNEQVPEKFDTWLKKEWDENNKLAGQYNRKDLTSFVNYESSAVYSLATDYFLAAGELTYAKDLHSILLTQPPFEKEADYNEIHFFDYILSKMTDWKYKKTTPD